MSAKKFRYWISHPVLCCNYEVTSLEADSEEEAIEKCKERDAERYNGYKITAVQGITSLSHHVCPYCKQQPGVEPWVSGYIVRCYNKECPTHPLFYCETAEEAFKAWDDYWTGYDKMCNNE